MSSTPEKVDHVEASLNYLTCRDKRPIISYEPPAGTPPGPDGITTQNIAIHNGRQLVHELSLDKQGFVLIRHETAVSNFYDAAEVRSVYYPELARLVKDATGASKVLVFDHNVRCGTAAERRDNGIREPVMIAHTDYTVRPVLSACVIC